MSLIQNPLTIRKMLLHEGVRHSGYHFIINTQEPIVIVGARSSLEYWIKIFVGDNQEAFYLPPKKEDANFFTELFGVAIAKKSPWKIPINHM